MQILNRIDWQLEDDFVIPKMTPQLMRKIKNLDALSAGSLANDDAICGMMKGSVDINKLIQYATFLEINT